MSAMQIFDVSRKIAVVTGAASGLGRAMAEAMAAGGATVAAVDRDAVSLQEACESIAVFGPARPLVCDVSVEAEVEAAFSDIVATFGRIDVLFNNAGIADPQPGLLHDYVTENWDRTVGVNLNGVFYCARAALRQMVKQGSGKLINIASMWGLAGASSVFPIPAYTATKGAVVNLTRELGLQYATHNIQVNAICPGFFETKLGAYHDPDFVKAITDFTPMRRIAQPNEIMGTALYLASSASDFVTGATLVIDGGCMAK
jgi:gluconate 5-dehydrogenase